jgi:DNA-binding transcriptional LysR family regulator
MAFSSGDPPKVDVAAPAGNHRSSSRGISESMGDLDRSWDKRIGERVRLRELRILHAVVQSGSMARAAQALSMTQPAVSQAIGHLEAALNMPVLERSPAGVAPTAIGSVLLRRALEAVDSLAEGLREIEALADPGSGHIVVGASESYIAGGALAATIMTLQRRFPRFRVVVVESNTAAMSFADLRERRVDVMFGRSARANRPDDIEQIPLLDEALLVVAGGHNAWAHAATMRFADLADRPWVLAPAGTAVYELVADAHRAEGVDMAAPAVTTYSMMLRLQLLASGPFVTAFPESLVRTCAPAWNLVALPLALGSTLPVSAYALRGRAAGRAITAFIDAARAVHRGIG